MRIIQNAMKWTNKIQAYGLITLVTALIWLYAEGQDIPDPAPVTVTVQLPASLGVDNDIIVDFRDHPAGGSDRQMSVKTRFRGSSVQLSKLQRGLERLILPLSESDVIKPDGSLRDEMVLPLGPAIAAAYVGTDGEHVTVTDLGITVESVEPANVLLDVDRLVREKINVEFHPAGVELALGWKSEPAQVTVEMPKRMVRDRYAGSPELFKVDAVVQKDVRELSKGTMHNLPGRVMLRGLGDKPHVRLIDEMVDLSFMIAQETGSYELKLVPVLQVMPPTESELFEVIVESDSRLLHGVTISGPSHIVSGIRKGEYSVVALYELTSDDLEKNVKSVPVAIFVVKNASSGDVIEVAFPPDPDERSRMFFESQNIKIQTKEHAEVKFTEIKKRDMGRE